jgi:hypothetical protein
LRQLYKTTPPHLRKNKNKKAANFFLNLVIGYKYELSGTAQALTAALLKSIVIVFKNTTYELLVTASYRKLFY